MVLWNLIKTTLIGQGLLYMMNLIKQYYVFILKLSIDLLFIKIFRRKTVFILD